MTLPALASTDDLADRLGVSLTGVELLRAEAVLNDASALIRMKAGVDWVNEAGDALEDVPALVEAIAIAAAHRAFRNPDGLAQSSVGDISVSYARDGEAAVYLTADERRAVRKAAGRSAVGHLVLATPWEVSEGE